ncbi:hypothetical protein Syun_005191 [Stephania yunnanensis]|uniref:Cytochrome P450 n=1 Tax=Stephania yunnanensis TaxID=152371 RepID=A0AAP0Q381_9MAGN
MEYYSLVQQNPMLSLLLFSLPLLFLLRLLSRSRRHPPYPPGPPGLPIVGNMFMMDQLTHRGLAKLAKAYGGIFHLKLGLLHQVTISNPDYARQVLQVQDSIFSNRPASIAIKYLTYDRADMAFAHYGPFWRQMRKLCVMKLFSRKRAESWDSVRDEVINTVKNVQCKSGTPVNFGALVFNLTNNIIYRAAFGSDLLTQEGQTEFVSILQEFSKLFGAFNLADFFSGLTWVDPQGLNRRLAKARRSLDGFIDKIIDEHLEKRRSNGGATVDGEDSDMVDDLLAFYGEAGGKRSDGDELQAAISLTRDNIKAIIMDVMFGGTETVASAIEWAMAELMKRPEELKKVQDELVQVVGLDRRVEESDLDKLTYLKCALKETLRLHPPIPLLLHETSEATNVGGYFVPARTRVVINAWAINRDKTAWEDADVFNPSRFLKTGAPDFKGSNFEFIPFGSGRRSCPGMQLGLYALEFAMAHLLHCFSWDLPDGMKPKDLDMEDVFGLTAPRAVRLVAVPTPRLRCPLLTSSSEQ